MPPPCNNTGKAPTPSPATAQPNTCTLHLLAPHPHSQTPPPQAQAGHQPSPTHTPPQMEAPSCSPVVCISRHDIYILRRPNHKHRQTMGHSTASSPANPFTHL